MDILIVDDEYYARKAVAKMVRDWDQDAAIREADDGLAALEDVRRQMPEVMLVDIRMPGMDGIELCRQIRAMSEDVDIIIISGYADFSYAQQAIHFRVEQYILKPVIPQSLTEALDRCRKARQARASAHLAAYERRVRLVVRLINGHRDAEEEQALLPPAHYQLYVVRLAEIEAEHGASHHQPLIQALCALDGVLAFYHDRYQNEIVILHGGTAAPQDMRADMRRRLEAMRAQGLMDGVWAIGTGAPFHDGGELSRAYQQAVYTLGQKLLSPDSFWCALPLHEHKERLSPHLQAIVSRLAAQDMHRAVKLLTLRLQGKSYTLRGLDDEFRYLCNAIIHVGYQLEAPNWSLQASRISLMRLCDFDSMAALCTYLTMCIQALSATEAEEQKDPVEQTIAYIRAHYQEDLLLSDIAQNVVFVNACYLSRCIKAKTGKTFSALLEAERMTHTRALLREGELSVSTVASMVGYTKVSYFIELYKKNFGATPGKDRKGS